MLRRFVAVGLGGTLAAALLAPPASAGSTPGQVKTVAQCAEAVYRPTAYVLTCADRGISITHVTYSTSKNLTWGGATVLGHGTYIYNDCAPSCAEGAYHRHPIMFYLSRIRVIHGQRLYTRMLATYAGLAETFSLPTSAV
jgi:hypothetical protein